MLPMIWIGECVRVRRCALGKGFTHQRAKRIETGDFVEQPAQLRLKGLAQNTLRARIGDVQTKLTVEHKYARAQIRQYALKVCFRLFQRVPVPFNRRARIRQLPGHRIKRLGQETQFILASDFALRRVIAARHFPRALRQQEKGARELIPQHKRQYHRQKTCEEERERQSADIHFAQAGPSQLLDLIVAPGALRLLHVACERSRYGAHELQKFLAMRRKRNQHAQAQRVLRARALICSIARVGISCPRWSASSAGARASTRPVCDTTIACCAPLRARNRSSAAEWIRPRADNRAAMRTPSRRSSASSASSAARPNSRPDSSAASILTSNHDSILRATNCRDRKSVRLPGNTPTSVKNTASFASSRVPKRPCRKRTISAAARPPTMSVKINATAAFAAYSHE